MQKKSVFEEENRPNAPKPLNFQKKLNIFLISI